MNTFSKFVAPWVMACVTTALISCGNNEKKEEPAKAADTTAAAITPAPSQPSFKPFDVLEVSHVVKNYATWRPQFDADSPARKSSGLNFITVGRNNANDNDVMVVLEVTDIEKAKAFAADPRLKKVMEKCGVISKPVMDYYHVIRYNPDSKENQWVIVTHKVKNFDAWLKVFDAEGSATRASNGLYDVVLARSLTDSNVVHLAFDIKDMAKAKASMNAPALKKLMTEAGVVGAPKIEYYTQGN